MEIRTSWEKHLMTLTAHVFLSYVHENGALVERLKLALENAGVSAWLDRERIHPGLRWEAVIRTAIRQGTAFLACFSAEYSSRDVSYMNRELRIAIEELQKRPVDRSWFIPLKLSVCEIPEFDIGAGETLQSLQYVDLATNWDQGIQRIVGVLTNHPQEVMASAQSGTPPSSSVGSVDHRVELRDVEAERVELIGEIGSGPGRLRTEQIVNGVKAKDVTVVGRKNTRWD